MSLGSKVKTIQNIMRQDTGVDGDAQRISQLGWLIFLKIFDDREKELSTMNLGYVSAVPEGLKWRDWAANPEGMTGDELLNFINNQLFPKLKNLEVRENDKRTLILQAVFSDSFNYMKSGTLLRQIINELNDIDFKSSKDRHMFNDVYEQILKDLQSAGNAGEFYTPRPVTQFIVEMINPQLGEKVFDPACGTGGFLTSVIDHLRKDQIKTAEDEKILAESLYGIEKKPLPHLLCTTNLILHGIDDTSNIIRGNSLTRPLRDYTELDRMNVVVTNPPFGGVEEDGIELNFPKKFQTKETADLFLVLIIHLLKNGGRAGLVLPDGTLFGEGVKTAIKEKLLEECNLHTIIRLPEGVFSPYTGIRTNLLFFTKGEPTSEVWFYEHKYPEGYKSYSKTKPMSLKEFDAEREWWNDRLEGENSWKVSIDELRARDFNLDIKNPSKSMRHSSKNLEDILSQFEENLDEIHSIFDSLVKEL
ncbi:N-6 DNA methylase [Candidatus Woesebacteria bacterium]|nr:N-6 DNA methylase [Candidatus Woesebacteria bacterium]